MFKLQGYRLIDFLNHVIFVNIYVNSISIEFLNNSYILFWNIPKYNRRPTNLKYL